MKRIKRIIVNGISVTALLVVLLIAPVARAQEEGLTVQVVQVDESRFPEIDVYVSVTDAAGQPVTSFSPEDFVLQEAGQRVTPIHASQAGEHGPFTAVLVIDKSGSMDVEGKMEAAREAAIAFVQQMRPGDTAGVIAFDTQVTTVQPLTGSQEALVEAIRSIEVGTDTALYEALHAASAMLEPVSGRKAIIAVTDGMNTAGTRTLEETLTLVGEQGTSVYTIGLGDPSQGTGVYAGIDEETLQAIADESKGIYRYAPGPADLRALYELLSLRLQNEYKFTYRSPTQLRDGVRRDVVVSLAAPAGSAEGSVDYNPGGFIPEVERGSTWGLFGGMFAFLLLLLVAPGVVGWIGGMVSGDDGSEDRGRRKGKGKKPPARGRIRLTDGGSASTRKRRG